MNAKIAPAGGITNHKLFYFSWNEGKKAVMYNANFVKIVLLAKFEYFHFTFNAYTTHNGFNQFHHHESNILGHNILMSNILS